MAKFAVDLLHLSCPAAVEEITNQLINQDCRTVASWLPHGFVDLLILDPPYNLTKDFNGQQFRAKEADDYTAWFEEMLCALLPCLKPAASVYVCSDWRTSTLVFPVLERNLTVRNRITWEREKGRGAQANWKNNAEDIWFCTRERLHF